LQSKTLHASSFITRPLVKNLIHIIDNIPRGSANLKWLKGGWEWKELCLLESYSKQTLSEFSMEAALQNQLG